MAYEYEVKFTPQDVINLRIDRGGLCDICGTDETRKSKAHAVDHDHSTGYIRGLLCVNCNMGLGYFKDSPGLLIQAANYIEDSHGNNNNNT